MKSRTRGDKDLVRKMVQTFRKFDANDDGLLDMKELINCVRLFFAINLTDFQAEELFNRLDANGDGVLDRQEFLLGFVGLDDNEAEDAKTVKVLPKNRPAKINLATDAFVQDQSLTSKLTTDKIVARVRQQMNSRGRSEGDVMREMVKIFSQYDLNDDGLIDLEELHECMRLFFSVNLTTAQTNALMKRLDQNSDGVLDQREFILGFVGLVDNEYENNPNQLTRQRYPVKPKQASPVTEFIRRRQHGVGQKSQTNVTKLGVERLEGLMFAKIDKKGRMHNSTATGVSYHRVEAFFKRYDENGDGEIDLGEFNKMLWDLGLKELHPDDVQGLFRRFDKNDDGSIDSDEFSQFFSGSFDAVDADGQAQNTIIDMPCTKDSLTSRFKPEKQLRHELKVEFKGAMERQGKRIRAEFLKLCEPERPGVRAIKETALNNMLREKFSIGIGAQRAVLALVRGIKRTSDDLITWKEFLRTFRQNLQEQGKFFNEVAKFDGPEIGIEKLRKIIVERLERKAVQRGAKNTTPSMRHLKIFFKDVDLDQDGIIQIGEFESLCLKLGIRHVNRNDVHGLFRSLDVDHSGGIDYIEFCDSVIQGFNDEKGILDLPATVDNHANQFKSDAELMLMAREDITRQCQRYRLTSELLGHMLCDENRPQARNNISKARVKQCLRGKLHAAIGNDVAVDLLFDKAKPDGAGNISLQQFKDTFLLDESQAQNMFRVENHAGANPNDPMQVLKREMNAAYRELMGTSQPEQGANDSTVQEGEAMLRRESGSKRDSGSKRGSQHHMLSHHMEDGGECGPEEDALVMNGALATGMHNLVEVGPWCSPVMKRQMKRAQCGTRSDWRNRKVVNGVRGSSRGSSRSGSSAFRDASGILEAKARTFLSKNGGGRSPMRPSTGKPSWSRESRIAPPRYQPHHTPSRGFWDRPNNQRKEFQRG
jgi:Ca2+-binding EF-hand superfamily protein